MTSKKISGNGTLIRLLFPAGWLPCWCRSEQAAKGCDEGAMEPVDDQRESRTHKVQKAATTIQWIGHWLAEWSLDRSSYSFLSVRLDVSQQWMEKKKTVWRPCGHRVRGKGNFRILNFLQNTNGLNYSRTLTFSNIIRNGLTLFQLQIKISL